MVKQYDNPFAQVSTYRSLTILTLKSSVEKVELAFDELVFSSAAFEVEEDSELWRIEMVLLDEVSEEACKEQIALLKQAGIRVSGWRVEVQEIRDWVSEIQSQFPPLHIGRFFIHGTHIVPAALPAISLEINAGRAFGTGEHATTAACLQAMEWLNRFYGYRHILDLGCGTGILALAAQRLWRKARVVGSDMDAVSIEVANENGRRNQAPLIRYHVACGFEHPALVRTRYDLIIANILARPLIRLAREMAGHTQLGGMIVLSGLLTRQEKDVLLAYRQHGFQLVKAFRREHWSALVLRKL